jgi:divalent metal cation (Fe/Co/Zn/Cd) transporter
VLIEAFIILAIEVLAFNLWSYHLTDRIVKNTPSMASYRLIKDPRNAAMMSGVGMIGMIVIGILYMLTPGQSELTPGPTALIVASLVVLVAATVWSHRRMSRLLKGEKR